MSPSASSQCLSWIMTDHRTVQSQALAKSDAIALNAMMDADQAEVLPPPRAEVGLRLPHHGMSGVEKLHPRAPNHDRPLFMFRDARRFDVGLEVYDAAVDKV
jgi:hypothetical protein